MDITLLTINIPTLLSILGGIGTLWIYFEKVMSEERKKRSDLERAFNEFQVYVAKNYVTYTHIDKMEERIMAAFERLGTRVDAVVDKLK